MANNKVSYLVRRLTVIDSEGKEILFPLAVISACKEDSVLYNTEIDCFDTETAGTLYFDSMMLRIVGDRIYEII